MSKIRFWLYAGFRYIKTKKNRGNVIFLFLFFGIALGLTALIVVIGIINGFQENHISRRIEIGSYHILITKKNNRTFNLKESMDLKKRLYENFNEIEAVVPFSDKEIMMKAEDDIYNDLQVIKLRAVDPEAILKDTRFIKYFKLDNDDSIDLNKSYSIILGNELFDRVISTFGKKVFLTPDISLASYRSKGVPFNIVNTFTTNSYDYDRYWAYISIYSLIPLTGKLEIDNIGIKVKKKDSIRKLQKELIAFLGEDFKIQSAEEINRGYFTALRIEKTMIVLLFFLIFLLLGINIFGALKLKTIEKKEDIAVFKALGASPRDIKVVFMIESFVLGFLGSFTGVMFGVFIAYNIGNIFKITEFAINSFLLYLSFLLEKMVPGLYFDPVKIYDSSVYYQSSFPVLLSYKEILIISLTVICITLLAAFLPVNKASKLKPNEIIRN